MSDEIKSFAPGSGRKPDRYTPEKKTFQIKLGGPEQKSNTLEHNNLPFSEQPDPNAKQKKAKKRKKRLKIALLSIFIVFILLLIWPIYLLNWSNGQIKHLSAIGSTHQAGLWSKGETWLIAGSDRRIKGVGPQDLENSGARSDTIMVLHKPQKGKISLMSIPRDTYVQIPGHSANKINSAFSFGGPKLLVQTVEKLTNIKVDHYVELNFEGLIDVVNAVGGVHLCYNKNVDDAKSNLHWKKGCHDVKGKTALAFARMRYSDPRGDFGREERQQQVINAIIDKVNDFPAILFPSRQMSIIKGGLGGLFFNKGTNVFNVIKMALTFKDIGARGLPSVKNPGYYVPSAGSTVLLDSVKSKKDFQAIMNGNWKPKKQKI